jgi:hypothetical protein
LATATERKDAFLKDFQDLLNKHKAEFEVSDDGGPYGRQTGIANICMMGEWDDDHECTNEYTEFDLPGFMRPENG